MFYCDKCAQENGWPQTFVRSMGICEMCLLTGQDCNDMPSRSLPPTLPPPPKSILMNKPKASTECMCASGDSEDRRRMDWLSQFLEEIKINLRSITVCWLDSHGDSHCTSVNFKVDESILPRLREAVDQAMETSKELEATFEDAGGTL